MNVWLALIAIQVLFGVNYVVSKVLIGVFPVMIWAALRTWISTILLFALARIFARGASPKGREFFLPLLGFALLGTILNQGSFLFGLSFTTATNASLINSLIPICTLLIAIIIGKESSNIFRTLGFICAFSGVLLVRRIENFTLSDGAWIGDLLIFVNVISFSTFLNVSRDFLKRYDPFWFTAWMFSYGSIGLGILSIPSWIGFTWPELTPGIWGAIAFSTIGGTAITYFLNTWTLARASSSVVALFIYLQPVVASLTAWAWFDERIAFRTAASSLLILAGLWLALVVGRERRRSRA